MPVLRQPFVQTQRDAWVEINLGYIERNFLSLKKLCKAGVDIVAIIKADAYGHGATMVAPPLIASGVSAFGVASVDEGAELRRSGCKIPIFVLGTVPSWSFNMAVENDLTLSVFTQEHINSALNAYNHLGIRPKVQVKIDTGMNRIGLNYKDASGFIMQFQNISEIELCGMFTHLACAEDKEISKMQLERFAFVKSQFPKIKAHLINTAGLISYPDMQYDMVRAGIGIFGLVPDLPDGIQAPELLPAMNLKGRIVHLKEIAEDEGVSYSYTYKKNHQHW